MTDRLPVIVLGATGMVGQRIVALLQNHPALRISAVAASARSAGTSYAEATTWRLHGEMPSGVTNMPVLPCSPDAAPKGTRVALSALDGGVAGPIEAAFRRWLRRREQRQRVANGPRCPAGGP